jgi:hypothetical protein
MRARQGVTMRWLEATALKAMTTSQGERELHDTQFGTTRGSLSTFLLSRSWRYRLAELNIHLINPTDVLAVPLRSYTRSSGCHSGSDVTPPDSTGSFHLQ